MLEMSLSFFFSSFFLLHQVISDYYGLRSLSLWLFRRKDKEIMIERIARLSRSPRRLVPAKVRGGGFSDIVFHLPPLGISPLMSEASAFHYRMTGGCYIPDIPFQRNMNRCSWWKRKLLQSSPAPALLVSYVIKSNKHNYAGNMY